MAQKKKSFSKKKYLRHGKKRGEKIHLVRRKTAKQKCGICKTPLRGVKHGADKSELHKLSKTQRKPSAPFGGMLCSECRTIVAEETAKTIAGKKIFEVDLRYRPFVEITLKRL
ncbi:MAG TPA: 50S ribosomal protein L34e [archaeon]|nr:50S ribosomal protein L34e [archaeon]